MAEFEGKSVHADSRQLETWPERKVTATVQVENTIDEFKYARKVKMECGHFYVRTYNDGETVPMVGGTVRCKLCAPKEVVH